MGESFCKYCMLLVEAFLSFDIFFPNFQVLNSAWDVCTPIASENALPCHDRESYNMISERAKPMNDPDGRHFCAFTYLRLGPLLMERHNLMEFERFVKRMHGNLRQILSVLVFFRVRLCIV